MITLTNARVSSYNIAGSDGSQPQEAFSMTYSTIAQTYWVETAGGKIEKAGTVTYDAAAAKLTSKA